MRWRTLRLPICRYPSMHDPSGIGLARSHRDASRARISQGKGLLALGAFLLTGATNIPYCGSAVYTAATRSLSGAQPPPCRVYRLRAPKAVLRLAVAANQPDRIRGLMA